MFTKSVALISHSNSGVSHYTYSLSAALVDKGVKNVHFITNKAFLCNDLTGLLVARLFGRSRWLPFQIVKAITYIARNNIQLLHFQGTVKYPVLTLCLIYIAHLFGRTVIYTAHDVVPHYARWYHREVMRKIYEISDGVIVHSKNNCEAVKLLTLKMRAIDVIPHGLYDMFMPDPPLSKDAARCKLGLDQERRILLFFGRIDVRKGAEALITQLSRLVEKEPGLLVLLVGRSSFPPGYLEKLASDGGVATNVIIIDVWVPDETVGAYFVASDAVILPYLEGSTSGVIKIALGTGTPVIATRVGELPEVIEDTGCGILIDMPLSEQDVNAIVNLISNNIYIQNQFDREKTTKEYSWSRVADKTCEFYLKCLLPR